KCHLADRKSGSPHKVAILGPRHCKEHRKKADTTQKDFGESARAFHWPAFGCASAGAIRSGPAISWLEMPNFASILERRSFTPLTHMAPATTGPRTIEAPISTQIRGIEVFSSI